MDGGVRGRREVRRVSVRRRSPMTRIPREPGRCGGVVGMIKAVEEVGREEEEEEEGVGDGGGVETGTGALMEGDGGSSSRPVEVRGVVRDREK